MTKWGSLGKPGFLLIKEHSSLAAAEKYALCLLECAKHLFWARYRDKEVRSKLKYGYSHVSGPVVEASAGKKGGKSKQQKHKQPSKKHAKASKPQAAEGDSKEDISEMDTSDDAASSTTKKSSLGKRKTRSSSSSQGDSEQAESGDEAKPSGKKRRVKQRKGGS